jgi:acyl-CoA thioesterase I
MKLICIGDSVTTGFGVFRNEKWTEILKERYGFDVVNKGINGDTTTGMLDRFHDDVVLPCATHVIIMGGSNDLMAKRELKNVQTNLRLMAEEAMRSGIIPVFATELPILPDMAKRKWSSGADYEYATEKGIQLREWLLGFCSENGIKCIDLFGLFEDKLENLSPSDLYIDGLHPNKLGQEMIVSAIANEFIA